MIEARIVEERIRSTMVGRANEIECFKRQFDQVLEGGTGLTVISGQPGIGKTFFVEHAAGLLSGGNMTYVHGKFRQYEKTPLVAFSEVIEQAVRHILTLPAGSLKHIINELNQKLGADGAIIISISPGAQILFGDRKAVNTDNLEQLKYRVRKAVCQFLEIISRALYPMILFIDDLQWADPLSMGIIETICQDYGFLNLHLVLAYRNDVAGKTYLNPSKLPKSDDLYIELGGLAYEDIERYIQLIFEKDMDHRDYLIRLLYGLSLGNPFNINRILRLFLQENVLSYSPQNKIWLIKLAQMEKLNLPSDVEQLLLKQINGLKAEEKALLELVACGGGRVGLRWLERVTDEDQKTLHGRLEGLCKNFLLAENQPESRQQVGAVYSITHDIVLKLAYNGMGLEEKSGLHYRIAGKLTQDQSRTFDAGERLTLASHLLKSDRDQLKRDRTDEWIDELYEAGLAARQTAAVEQALELFQCCAELLLSQDPAGKRERSLSIGLELGECQYICGQVEEAKRRLETLMAEFPDMEDQIRIKRKYVNLSACNGDFEKVMETGFQILDLLGHKPDPRLFLPDLIKSMLLFRTGEINRLANSPAITDTRLLYILETLTVMGPSANRIDDRTSAMIALKMANISAVYGNSDYSPVAFASYCYVLFHILKSPEKAKRLEAVALAQLERSENAASKSAALCILGSLTHHWFNSLEETAACLEKSTEEGEKEGASLYGSYAATFTIITKYVMGTTFEELKQYIDLCRTKQNRLEHYLTRSICELFADYIRRLEEGAASESETPAGEDRSKYKYRELFAGTIKLNGDILLLQRLYLEGKTEEAYRLALETEPQADLHRGFVLNVEFLFYSMLARLAMHRNLPQTEKQRNKKRIEKHLKELKYWVGIYKDNHFARYLLAEAEYTALFKAGKSPERLYHEAIDFAEKQGNIPLAALANLLTARYHRENEKLSRFFAAEAAERYHQWGAAYIRDLTNREFGLDRENEPAAGAAAQPGADNAAESSQGEDLNILSHMTKMEKMTEDEGYLYLLDLLNRLGYMDYCAVFFERSDELYLKYEKRRNDSARVHSDPINMNHLGSLPHKVIRYAARTESEVVSEKESPSGLFANDPYLTGKTGLSFACLPMKYLGVFIGMIYLEKAGGSGLDGDLLPFVKGFVPSLISRQTTIREVDVQNILNPRSKNSIFTERELEVLKLVAEGKSNAEISKELFVALGTVRNHLSSIYGKLEADNRVKAVIKARELKIIR